MNIQEKLNTAIDLLRQVSEELNSQKEKGNELIDHPLHTWIKNDDGLHSQYVKSDLLSYEQCEKLCRDYHKENVKEVITAILSWDKYPRKVNSLYLTARNWLNRRDGSKKETGTQKRIQVT